MIQRIQSIFLFLATILVFLMFFFPIADLVGGTNLNYIFRYRGLYQIVEGKEKLIELSIPLAILLLLTTLIPLFTIFLYKKRTVQMKLCILSIILDIVSLGLIVFYIAFSFSKIEANVHYQIIALMPVIALILTVMAYNGIRKDEKLIKSLDRIR